MIYVLGNLRILWVHKISFECGFASRMSQRSITSFFNRKTDSTAAKQPSYGSESQKRELQSSSEEDDSCNKHFVKKKRVARLISDSEDEEGCNSKNCEISSTVEEDAANNSAVTTPLRTYSRKYGNKKDKSPVLLNGESSALLNKIKNGIMNEEQETSANNTAKTSSTDKSPVLSEEQSSTLLEEIKNDIMNKQRDTSENNKEKATTTGPEEIKHPGIKDEEAGERSVKSFVKHNGNSEDKTDSERVDYHPSKANYHPINDAIWKHGEKTPYMALARTFQEIEEESGRLKMIDILSNYFRSVIVLSPEDLLPSIYLCLNKLGPVYEGMELGIADMYLMKAIAQCTGRNLKQIRSDAHKTGDLGTVAENSRTNQRTMFKQTRLTISSVFSKLKEIAQLTGQSSVNKKIEKVQALFIACKPCEARYIIRSLAGKLRIGLAEQSVLQALATACVNTPPGQEYPPSQLTVPKKMSKEEVKKLVEEEALILKTTYCECPNYDLIVPVLLKEGLRALPEHCKLTPGIPLKPMLAQPTKCVDEVFQQFEGQHFTCEWKYDGERAQIHVCEDGVIKIFSRNLEDNTSKYPDVISSLRAALKPQVKSCILDTEAVAWDRERKSIMPFQILSTRKRKDAVEEEIKVQVRIFMFDLLYINGQPLVQNTLNERRKLLKQHFEEVDEKFSYVTSLDTSVTEEIQEFMDESIKGNCEGLMVKSLEKNAEYKIAKRARSWLKLKKDYLQGIGDTLDLVVIGGYLGRGKRTGNYGGFLLACYDPESEQYQSICKIGTGFTDENLANHAEFLKQHVISSPRPYYSYDPTLAPDHWFDAVQVWEIKCADLSLSPTHRAAIGIVDAEKGISLRFPRFLRVRDDKSVEHATTASQVAEMYGNQDQIKNQSKYKKLNEEDFY